VGNLELRLHDSLTKRVFQDFSAVERGCGDKERTAVALRRRLIESNLCSSAQNKLEGAWSGDGKPLTLE
jgi:hypothetical protein